MKVEMKNILAGLVFTALSALTLAVRPDGCSSTMGAEASRRFAYELYSKAIAESDSESNVLLAPTTVASALAMIVAGAGGSTKEQIWRGLKFDSTAQHFTEDDLSCLLRMYNDTSGDDSDDSDAAEQTLVLQTATRLFGENSYKFNKNYRLHTESFGAKLKKLNFVGDAENVRQKINRWVARKTEDKIQDLFPENSIDSNTILAIASAIYFKGLWAIPFRPESTRTNPFRVSETRVVQAEFMHNSDKFRSSHSKDLQANFLELPYQGDSKHNVSMIIVLPNSMMAFERELSEERLGPAISELFTSIAYTVDVYLPKFKISAEYKLKPILASMGITDMFSPDVADLSGMRQTKSEDHRPLYVSAAVHKTFIEVDEKGTEAAGAAGFGFGVFSLPLQFNCNQPFLTIIYEKQSQSILFIGKINDPTVE